MTDKIKKKLKHKNIELLGKLRKETPSSNGKIKHIKPMDYNCHVPDLLQSFSHVENSILNLVL